MRVMLPVVLGASVFAGVAAAAKPPLSEVAEIENKLFAAAVGWEISELCDDIAARRLKAIGEALRCSHLHLQLVVSVSNTFASTMKTYSRTWKTKVPTKVALKLPPHRSELMWLIQ